MSKFRRQDQSAPKGRNPHQKMSKNPSNADWSAPGIRPYRLLQEALGLSHAQVCGVLGYSTTASQQWRRVGRLPPGVGEKCEWLLAQLAEAQDKDQGKPQIWLVRPPTNPAARGFCKDALEFSGAIILPRPLRGQTGSESP